ncbi:MAG: hypothetical protein PUE49_06635 [Eggerthellales bacterium]|nr:hypothetical protein [Eggerthellales bacterium]
MQEAEHGIYVLNETIEAGTNTVFQLQAPIPVKVEVPVVRKPELAKLSGGRIGVGILVGARPRTATGEL